MYADWRFGHWMIYRNEIALLMGKVSRPSAHPSSAKLVLYAALFFPPVNVTEDRAA